MDAIVKSYYNQAKNSYDNKDYHQALKYIKKAINIDNHDFNCWCLITEIYLALNQIEEASSCATTLLNIDSNNHQAWHLRARVLLGLMRYDEALMASNKSLQLDNENNEYKEINKNIKAFIEFRIKTKERINQTSNKGKNDISSTSHKEERETPTSNERDETASLPEEDVFNPINKYESIFKVTSSKNINLFKQKKLNTKIYYNLLDDVMKDVLRKIDTNSKANIYNKITQLVSIFAKIQYESIDEAEGLYSCNIIKIDPDGKTIKKIAIIIHELAHHLLSEIFEVSLMYLFDSVKTDAIEAFVWYALNFKEEYRLMNEYCAHTVENYFMPFHYKNFESFNQILNEFDLTDSEDIAKINHATRLGNTFAQDIIYMLNKYFDDKLKKQIMKQFIFDGYNFYMFKGTKFKTNEFFYDDVKFDKINSIFIETIIYIKTHFAIFDLLNYKKSFNVANKRRYYSS